jgi:tetratricopeptide (TPR) repeat protein
VHEMRVRCPKPLARCAPRHTCLLVAALATLVADPWAHAHAKASRRAGGGSASGLSADERLRQATLHQHSAVQMANTGRVAEALREFQASAELLEGLESSRPLHAQITAMMGNAHTLLGDITKGLEYWLKAVKIDPTIQDARQNVIKSLQDQGRYADALKHARKAAKLQPANPDFLVAMGDSCKALRNFTCAKSSYRRVLEQDPAHFVATFSLAVAHRDLMQLSEALPLFERAGEIDPHNTAVVNALAVVRGDTCLWGDPDFSDPAHTAAAGNRFIQTAQLGLPRRASPIHPLLLAYYLDDPDLLRRVVASHARQAERETAVYIGHGAIDRATNQVQPTSHTQTQIAEPKPETLLLNPKPL